MLHLLLKLSWQEDLKLLNYVVYNKVMHNTCKNTGNILSNDHDIRYYQLIGNNKICHLIAWSYMQLSPDRAIEQWMLQVGGLGAHHPVPRSSLTWPPSSRFCLQSLNICLTEELDNHGSNWGGIDTVGKWTRV